MKSLVCDRCGKSFDNNKKLFNRKCIFKIRSRDIDLCEDCQNDLFLFLFGYNIKKEAIRAHVPYKGSYLKILYDILYNPHTNEIEEGWEHII